jgi:sugar lactone lactonase YvrE
VRQLTRAIVAAVAVLLAYLLLWPVPIEPVAWTPPEPTAPDGPWASNTALGQAELFLDGIGEGPEDFAVAPDGTLYTGLLDGRIVAVLPGAQTWRDVVQTGGRPLGLEVDAQGDVVACVVPTGLVRYGAGEAELLADASDGVPIEYADDLDIAPDGTIWFSDASRDFGPADAEIDALVGRPTGRLLAWSQAEGVRTVLDGLRYANGVAVAPDGTWVAVSETLGLRVTRLWLDGPDEGRTDALVDDLPGFPDNCDFDGEGRLWVAMVKPRSRTLDFISPHPWLRKVVLRLPKFLVPRPPEHGWIAAFDVHGTLLHQLQDPGGTIHNVTSVTAAGDALVLGSLHMTSAARIAAP